MAAKRSTGSFARRPFAADPGGRCLELFPVAPASARSSISHEGSADL